MFPVEHAIHLVFLNDKHNRGGSRQANGLARKAPFPTEPIAATNTTTTNDTASPRGNRMRSSQITAGVSRKLKSIARANGTTTTLAR